MKLCSRPAGSRSCTSAPSAVKPAEIRSISGCAQVNTAWNITNKTHSRINSPATGCSSTASSRVVSVSGLAGMRTARSMMRSASRCAARNSATVGTVQLLSLSGAGCATASSSSRRNRSSVPPRRTAAAVITGTPSSVDNASRSISMPRRRAMSIMLSTSSIGRPARLSSITSRKASRRLVASATQSRRSGALTLAKRPSTTSRVTCSSGLRARSE